MPRARHGHATRLRFERSGQMFFMMVERSNPPPPPAEPKPQPLAVVPSGLPISDLARRLAEIQTQHRMRS
jgi:hypothetical protein